MSLLAKQLAAIRQEKGIPERVGVGRREVPPSVLFSPEEASRQDEETVAALAQRGLKAASALEPDLGVYASLFEGPAVSRDMLTPDENEKLNSELRRFLLLLSPHLPTRAAQECLEGLLRRFHVHVYNVDDLLAGALAYHDSPLFTRLVQGLSVEGKPRWAWLQKFKEGPLGLPRATLAKYCLKDLAVLTFLGQTLQDVVETQKPNRALFGLFAALWLDVISMVPTLREEMVEVAMPTLLFVLRRPHVRGAYSAALTVASALSVKADLSPAVRTQLVDRVARHAGHPGPEARAALGLLALLAQQQDIAEALSAKSIKALAAAGADAVASAVPRSLDGSNLLAGIVRAALLAPPSSEDGAGEDVAEFAGNLLSQALDLGQYAAALAEAALLAFCEAPDAERREQIAGALREPLSKLGKHAPLELSTAFERVVSACLESSLDPAPLVELLAPETCSTAPSDTAPGRAAKGVAVPLLLAFAHKSAAVRREALLKAVQELENLEGEAENPRQRLLASLALRAVQDPCEEVALEALALRALWASLPQAPPNATVPCLLALLRASRVGGAEDLLTASALTPAALRCCAWVYARSDCTAENKEKLDAALLPLLVLAAVGLDAADASSADAAAALRAAVVEVASASTHPLLAQFKKGKLQGSAAIGGTGHQLGPLSAALCAATDARTAEGLCNLVQGLPWREGSIEATAVGGAAAQRAAAVLLAAALPRVLAELGNDSVGPFAVHCALACERLQSFSSGEGDNGDEESLCGLVHALLLGISNIDQKRIGVSPSKRKPKGDASRRDPKLQEAFVRTLRLVAEQPKRMASALRAVLGSRCALLRPCVLQLALLPVPAGRPCAGASNALLLVRSLLAKGSAGSWDVNQSILPPLMAQLASAESSDVRSNVLGLFQELKKTTWKEVEQTWSSPFAATLQEAGILKTTSEVLTKSAWSAVGAKSEFSGMAPKICVAFLEHMLAHTADIVRDGSAACSALAKFLDAQLAAATPSLASSAFWGLGLSMLVHPTQSALIESLPAAGFLGGFLDNRDNKFLEPLRLCAEDTVTAFKESVEKPIEVSTVLEVSAMKALESVETVRKPSPALVEANSGYLKAVALPFVVALQQRYEASSTAPIVSESLLEVTGLLCRYLARIASGGNVGTPIAKAIGKSQQDEACNALFKLCVACSAIVASKNTDDDVDIASLPQSSRLPAVVRDAFVAVNLDAHRLHSFLQQEQILEPKKQFSRSSMCLKLVLTHIASLRGAGMKGVDELGAALSSSAQSIATRLKKAGAAELLTDILSAIATIAEQLNEPDAERPKVELDVAGVCESLQSVCVTTAKQLSTPMLAAIIRACTAFSCILPPVPAPKKDASATTLRAADLHPAALACVESLRNVEGPLSAETLALLKGGLMQMRRYPEAPPGPKESSLSVAMRRDVLAQSRLRPILCTVLASGMKLVEEVNVHVCQSLAQSIGAKASLDLAVLLLLARPDKERARKRSKKRAAQRKRKAIEEGDAIIAEITGVVEDVVDDALALLSAVSLDTRYHCLGTLVQTLCALAYKLSGQMDSDAASASAKGLGPLWGPALLPQQMLDAYSNEQLFALLESGLTLVARFISEHGIPDELDAEAIDTAQYRVCSPTGEASSDEVAVETVASTAALSMCYVGTAACALDALIPVGAGTGGCRAGAAHLRGLSLRSLAVNHPTTFFRCLCFALRLPDFTPPAGLMATELSGKELQRTQAGVVLASATQALSEARDLREASGEAPEMDDEEQRSCSPHCEALLRHLCGSSEADAGCAGVGAEDSDLSVEAWRFLDALCAASATAAARPVMEICVPAAAGCLSGAVGGGRLRVAVAACACVQTIVTQLGRGILDKLSLLASTLLDLLEALASLPVSDDAAALQRGVFATLGALMESVGAFMSPFLERILALCTAPSTACRTPLLQTLGRQLAGHVPHRLLLPAVQRATAAAAAAVASSDIATSATEPLTSGLIVLQRLAVLQTGILASAAPDFVAAGAEAANTAIMQLASAGAAAAGAALRAGTRPEDLPATLGLAREQRIIPAAVDLPWAEHGAVASVVELHGLAGAAFAQFALRLSFDGLRPRFAKALEWARGGRPRLLARRAAAKGQPSVDGGAGAEHPGDVDACRALAALSLTRALVDEAPDIAEVLVLPAVAQDLASCLVASKNQATQLVQERTGVTKKRRAGLAVSRSRCADVLTARAWWWSEVSTASLALIAEALRHAGAGASQAKAVEEALDALAEPCVSMLDLFEYLPAAEDSSMAATFLRSLGAAAVALAGAADAARVKRLLVSTLEKTRSDDAEVRLAAVSVVHRVWTELGAQAVSGLSEVVMYAAELLEDEEPRVEAEVRGLVKTIEDCTGESLQESLKK